jgi:hypothetical protein
VQAVITGIGGHPRPVVIIPNEDNLVKLMGQSWADSVIADAVSSWHPRAAPLVDVAGPGKRASYSTLALAR